MSVFVRIVKYNWSGNSSVWFIKAQIYRFTMIHSDHCMIF